MTTAADVRAALAAAVESTGMRCAPYLAELKNVPCAQVWRKAYDPRMVLGQAKATYLYGLIVYCGRVDSRAAMELLDECSALDGDLSILAAVQNEDNWDGVEVDYVSVVDVAGEAISEVAGVQYLTTEFEIEVVF